MRQKYQNQNVIDENKRVGLADSRLPVLHPIYYGQCGEDYIAVSILRAVAVREGLDLTRERYLEVGANHPVSTSATYLLHTGLGMTGVLVEANPNLISDLRKARPADDVLHAAVVLSDVGDVDFYVSDHSELSSLSVDFIKDFPHAKADVLEKIKVPAIEINDLIRSRFVDKAPIFMSIDVEGLDADLVEAIDFSEVRPFVLQIESNRDWDPVGYDRILKKLSLNGYVQLVQTDVNLMVADLARLKNLGWNRGGLSVEGGAPTLRLSDSVLEVVLGSIDVLSFDVFDTLLARRCAEPTDVFGYLEEKYKVAGFKEARIKAESAARKKFRHGGWGETSLEEIYSVIRESMDLPDRMEDFEIDAEGGFLYAIPGVLGLIALAREKGKRIIAVTDMYLSSRQVEGLLQRNGIFVDCVYSSSDHRDADFGKYNGRMFAHVCKSERVAPDRVLHIGDNLHSDLSQARAAGLKALHTDKVQDVVKRDLTLFPVATKNQSESSASGIVLGHLTRDYLSTGKSVRSAAERFGYDYAGPLLAGFVRFICEEARSGGVKRLVLLARDGVIVKKALDILGPKDLSWRVIPSSRRMTVFPLYADGGWPAIRSLFGGDDVKVTPSQLVERLVLKGLFDVDSACDTPRPVAEVVNEFHEQLLKQALGERAQLLNLLRPELERRAQGDAFAWVDVGWALTSVSALNKLIGTAAPGFFVGSHGHADPNPGLQGYLFERGHPEAVCNSVMSAVEIVELIFSDTGPSTAYLKCSDSGEVEPVCLEKSAMEQIRDGFIADVQRGALAFLRDISSVFDGVNSEELRVHNRLVFQRLSSNPPADLYALLSQIPHDRMAGAAKWMAVGDYWKPTIAQDGVEAGFVPELGGGALKRFKLKLMFHALTSLASLHPPLSKRMTDRFRRSANKRLLKLRSLSGRGG